MTLVREFQVRFGLPAPPTPPLVPDPDLVRLRARLIREEFHEVIGELEPLAHTTDPVIVNRRLRALLKELADLRYVVEGTAVAFGLPMDEAYEIVHASNMTKTGGPDAGGKILKGDGYVPPDLVFLVPDITEHE